MSHQDPSAEAGHERTDLVDDHQAEHERDELGEGERRAAGRAALFSKRRAAEAGLEGGAALDARVSAVDEGTPPPRGGRNRGLEAAGQFAVEEAHRVRGRQAVEDD